MRRFDEATLRSLEKLQLVARHVRAGRARGERRSSKRGASQEFADYRNYVRGDDLRRLDWNVFARLERPFLKLFEEEEDLAVHIVVDASASMDWPAQGEDNKLTYALRLAAALGYVGLLVGDQLAVTTVGGRRPAHWGPYRGAGRSMELFGFLDTIRAEGSTRLNQALRSYAHRAQRPGLLLLLSDLFSSDGYEAGMDALLARGYEVGLLHILSPDELDPPIGGDVRLVDVETAATAELSVDAASRRLYQRRLESWRTDIAAHCRRREATYVPANTGLPWDLLVQTALREQGLVR
jgi:uncharacterized protein (DUF58 family)